jgi:hypothetical protein
MSNTCPIHDPGLKSQDEYLQMKEEEVKDDEIKETR